MIAHQLVACDEGARRHRAQRACLAAFARHALILALIWVRPHRLTRSLAPPAIAIAAVFTAVHLNAIAVVGSYPAADTSACLYDSGAPYFSTGPDCPHSNAETTARVDNITEWIRTAHV